MTTPQTADALFLALITKKYPPETAAKVIRGWEASLRRVGAPALGEKR